MATQNNFARPSEHQRQARLIEAALLKRQTVVLPPNASMKGRLATDQELSIRLDGNYEGRVEMLGGAIHISASSVVRTEGLVADYILVDGTVVGDLHARKGLELSPTANVEGSICYERDLDVHPGARIAGTISRRAKANIADAGDTGTKDQTTIDRRYHKASLNPLAS